MASPAPQVTIARPSRSNGVLSIPASATQRKHRSAPERQTTKRANARQKIIIRRLPPGLSKAEFEQALGDDWKTGGDKVDWAVYKAGKVSKDPAKPSRLSRAYLHLTKQEHVALLSEHVRSIAYNYAKTSSKDSTLLGYPSVEFAPYGRVPNSRLRKDARQGTIDQDPEFIDFLESLTNPITKSLPGDQEDDATEKSNEKVTVTPLVQFLKDKKANKGKENPAPSKGGKHPRQDTKETKSTSNQDVKPVTGNATVSSPKKRSAQALKVEQAARDAVKVLNKQVANSNRGASSIVPPAGSPTAKASAVVPNSTANAALADKKRERGNVSAAAKILQRDLGLGGNAGGRGARRDLLGNAARTTAANTNSTAKQDTGGVQALNASVPPSAPASTTPVTAIGSMATAKPAASQPPIGPAASRAIPKTPAPVSSNTSSPSTTTAPPKPMVPPSTATQAFLKHANPSQGITEPLLEGAFVTFGKISKVEIDKKKGFAYVDFAEPESLQKAIKASPIKVAQGQVVVLERKSGPNLQARNARGGGVMMGNRGGGMPMRGGSMRGRGGFGRGGMGMPNVNNARPTAAAVNAPLKQVPAATQAPTTAVPTSSTEEGDAAPPVTVPVPVASTSTAPAD